MIVREMHDAECYRVIKTERLARLACAKDNQPYIVPIQYAYANSRLFSFSLPGQKIDMMRSNPHVCLEIDHFTDTRHWRCVVIRGVFYELMTDDERQLAWEHLQDRNDWWEPGALKPTPQQLTTERSHLFYEIVIDSLTGREAAPA
jgi:nitroimidazol reductase NimA-like FMN-containing flavoprotein (pyridoxamine 5'-phosphate oxidase superfamily)